MNIKDVHKFFVVDIYQIIEKILKKIQNNSMKITVIYLDKISMILKIIQIIILRLNKLINENKIHLIK